LGKTFSYTKLYRFLREKWGAKSLKLKIFGGKNKEKEELPEDIRALIKQYAERHHINYLQALKELIQKGLRYSELERQYGKDVDSRELWDKRFYYLKIESGYLYYRLRLKEVIDELKTLAIRFAGVLGSLETCYKQCMSSEALEVELKKLADLKEFIRYYLETYVITVNKELEEKKYADDKEIIKFVEKTLEKYKRYFMKE